jgi:hypothetical protein
MLDWLRERWKYGLTDKSRRRMRAFERQFEIERAYEAELQHLPIVSARREALRLLAATALLKVTPASEPQPPLVATLGPELRDFFALYRRVEVTNGAIFVDVADIEPCAWWEGGIEIGAFDGHVHLMVRPGDDKVFEVADDIDERERVIGSYPSIHHWILAVHYAEELADAGDA